MTTAEDRAPLPVADPAAALAPEDLIQTVADLVIYLGLPPASTPAKLLYALKYSTPADITRARLAWPREVEAFLAWSSDDAWGDRDQAPTAARLAALLQEGRHAGPVSFAPLAPGSPHDDRLLVLAADILGAYQRTREATHTNHGRDRAEVYREELAAILADWPVPGPEQGQQIPRVADTAPGDAGPSGGEVDTAGYLP